MAKHQTQGDQPTLDARRARRLSVAFFHKANHDAVIDPAELFPGRTTVGKKPARSKR